MTAYVVAKLTITDPKTYASYGNEFMAAFTPFGGKLLAVDEAPDVIEGEWRCTRTVLLEFPSKAVMRRGTPRQPTKTLSSTVTPPPPRISCCSKLALPAA